MYVLTCLLLLLYNYVEANFTSKWQRRHRIQTQNARHTMERIRHLYKKVGGVEISAMGGLESSWAGKAISPLHPIVVLFPAAQRIRRSSADLQDPVLQTSELEVELLYEFLLTGVHLDKENRLSLLDPELASLRKAATFDVVCNDVIPKSISDIKRLATMLSHQRGPLRKVDFERTLLTAAYAAYRTSTFRNVHQQKVWLETLGNLFTTLKRDLTF